MSKIYLLAVNTGKRFALGNNTTWQMKIDARNGDEITRVIQHNYNFNDGWRVYAFTTKRERDAIMELNVQTWDKYTRETSDEAL